MHKVVNSASKKVVFVIIWKYKTYPQSLVLWIWFSKVTFNIKTSKSGVFALNVP